MTQSECRDASRESTDELGASSCRVVSGERMAGLSEVSEYRHWYENNDVRIPLYEDMTTAQLSLRLPISLGIPKQIIDNSADALFGDGRFLDVRMIGPDDAESARLQALWERVFKDNSFRQRLLTDTIDAGICGGILYSVSYDPSGPRVLRVQSISYDQLWDIEFDEQDSTRVVSYILQWEQVERNDRRENRRRWYRVRMDAEEITRYRAVQPHVERSDGVGVEFGIVSRSTHGLGIIPVAHLANSLHRMQSIGDSEIAPLAPMLDAVNQMVSDAYWQSYNDQSILKAINIAPPDDDDIEQSVVRLGGDQIHFLTGNDQIKQDIVRMKPVGIPDSFFKTLNLLIGQIYKTASEANLDPLKATGSNISGVALRLLYEPLAKKTFKKRIHWAGGFDELARIIFAYANAKSIVLDESGDFVLGGPKYRLEDTEVRWGSLVPGDDAEEQRIILGDLSAGLLGLEEARIKRGL
ncbi:phage portal protein [bacterium]|nr:phage portal protein [bacterium]